MPKQRDFIIIAIILFTITTVVHSTEVNCFIYGDSEKISFLTFEQHNQILQQNETFFARKQELGNKKPEITVSGDFNGDGLDEIAMFYTITYYPNLNDSFSCSTLLLFKSFGKKIVPIGQWYSVIDTSLVMENIRFVSSGDYNSDGFDDIAVIYNDYNSTDQQILVFESSGHSFSNPKPYFNTPRNEFNFSAVDFVLSGDFNGSKKDDIAVFYNYFGNSDNTKQRIFIFEATDSAFILLPPYYTTDKGSFNFSDIISAVSMDVNRDGFTDICVAQTDIETKKIYLKTFTGNISSFAPPMNYLTIDSSEIKSEDLLYMLGGDFTDDKNPDILLFYNNQKLPSQQIYMLKGNQNNFSPPSIYFNSTKTETSFDQICSVHSGNFFSPYLIFPTIWKNNKKGALSFTFDDGYKGAFDFGASYLESLGLKGTFYIFSDTILINNKNRATFNEIEAFKKKGHEIASHTFNHAYLGQLSQQNRNDSIDFILSIGKQILDKHFNQQTLTLSIPYGNFSYTNIKQISHYFKSARSSQYGFNLATPLNFYTLYSYPVVSTRSPYYVVDRISIAARFGYYLPLMYHNITDDEFDENSLIYTYSFDNLKTTINGALENDVWIDTHENIYKYIQQRNALKIELTETGDDHYSFILDDELNDSIFNMELTVHVSIPEKWSKDTVLIKLNNDTFFAPVVKTLSINYIALNLIPQGQHISIFNSKQTTEIKEKTKESLYEINIMPNPSNGYPVLYLPNTTLLNKKIIISNSIGKIIWSKKFEENIHEFKIPLSDNGVYILSLYENDLFLCSGKLIIKR